MKLPLRSVPWLLPILLTGCFGLPFHKTQPVPASALAPLIHHPSQTIELVEIDLPPQDMVIAAAAIYNVWEEPQPIRPPARHRRPPNLTADDTPPATEPATPASPPVSAIGQLSSGDPANFRQQTQDSIAAIERRLNGINRPLSDSEQKTADHIREFLKEAKAALASGDVDGAYTLAAKAQVLLAELTK